MNHERPTILGELRQLVPSRPLRFGEALRIVELQAHRCRELLAISSDKLPMAAIDDIPRITVARTVGLPVSGLTQWHNGTWVIATNAGEPWQRQRFSTAHELFHAVNHTTRHWLHPDDPSRGEQLADYFAGCLLMPRMLIKRYHFAGDTPALLARRFGVSLPAIAVRLAQLGLSEPARRCQPPATSFRRPVRHYTRRPSEPEEVAA